jgi:hypothetical protein
LIGAFWRLEDPPANKLTFDEPGPEAQAPNVARGCEPTAMEDLDLFACAAVAQVAHDFVIRVEFHLVLEVSVGQWHKPDAVGMERRLNHDRIFVHRPPLWAVS